MKWPKSVQNTLVNHYNRFEKLCLSYRIALADHYKSYRKTRLIVSYCLGWSTITNRLEKHSHRIVLRWLTSLEPSAERGDGEDNALWSGQTPKSNIDLLTATKRIETHIRYNPLIHAGIKAKRSPPKTQVIYKRVWLDDTKQPDVAAHQPPSPPHLICHEMEPYKNT